MNITLNIMMKIVRAVDFFARHLVVTFGFLIIAIEVLLLAFILALATVPGLVPNIIGGIVCVLCIIGIIAAAYTLYRINGRKNA